MLEGELRVTLDGDSSALQRGDVVLVPADSELRVDAGAAGATAWVRTTRDWYVHGCVATGYALQPLQFFDDRARPHPVATLLQASAADRRLEHRPGQALRRCGLAG